MTADGRVHVLHVVPTLRPGGMELALARVINGLVPQGISHGIAVLKGEAALRDRIHPSVRIHCLHAGAREALVPFRLRRLIRQEAPTVIHARNLGAWPEIAVARLLVQPRPPLVFSFHGVAEARPLPLRWRILSRVLARMTTRLFTVSDGSRRFLVDHVGLREQDIRVIPNGVDTSRFSPRQPAGREGELVIGTVGSLSPVKNQALLIRACHRAMQQGVNLRLEIAGEGRERPALEGLIASLEMAGKVRLLGHIDDTPAFLNGLDMFALTSDSEAHPNALSEAMACCLPCIASRVGGVPEITDRGRAALLFDRGDESALADCICDLAASPGKRQELGAAALELTVERYSMDVMLNRYREMYRELSTAFAAARGNA